MLLGMKTDTETIDLRPMLDPARWQASDELKMKLRKPWQRQSAEIVNLNDWIAERTKRQFACGGSQEHQSC